MKNYTIAANGKEYDVMAGEVITIKDWSNYAPGLENNGGAYVCTSKFWQDGDSWFCQELSSCDFQEPEEPFEVSFEEILERIQAAESDPDFEWWIGKKEVQELDEIEF